MPELPDVTLYVEHLARRVVGEPIEKIRILGLNLLRTFEPPPEAAEGRRVRDVRRMGKRIVVGLEGDLFLVLHLMIAGRLRWKERGAALQRKVGLAAFDFPRGTLVLTEAATKKRASLTIVEGEAAVRALDPGGLEPLEMTVDELQAAITRESHTLKRALTDPHILSGIGNAYSDEILHRARLSPLALSGKLAREEVARLWEAIRAVLIEWTERLRAQFGEDFPEKVTAFRLEMAVHGKYKKPCPVCGSPVQRIVYADNETNYCARCQTGGRLLADRSLSRLLKADWPKMLEELEA
ncbi:MAG: formamidopyrimidine-DNA glycosylase [Candidatus Eisenbacteria bacterium]|uniref:Formamidopyrimidine-DNA glycosylase n=1 Tax=Eiseniibacteriota bacterium TaxID=2212470 RepID=A0A538TZM3_UNCEI|nr:MAG: formamidopyrimidine-DNA glycosylase [Candidatus Eisenbacteria bacterium]